MLKYKAFKALSAGNRRRGINTYRLALRPSLEDISGQSQMDAAATSRGLICTLLPSDHMLSSSPATATTNMARKTHITYRQSDAHTIKHAHGLEARSSNEARLRYDRKSQTQGNETTKRRGHKRIQADRNHARITRQIDPHMCNSFGARPEHCRVQES